MIEPMDALRAVGQLSDGEIEVADAALQLARVRSPQADWQAAAAHLSELAREAARLGPVLDRRSLETRLGGLAGLIHARHAYAGDEDTYDDLANADLIRVTERRRGLPVSLGIVWLHCIRAAGWQGSGVDFPGHFLVRIDADAGPSHLLVDVFGGGAAIDSKALLEAIRERSGAEAGTDAGLVRPMRNREVLLRLQRNIAGRLRAAGALEDALLVSETMSAIAPLDPAPWFERAALNDAMGRPLAAVECFEHILALVPSGPAAEQARSGIKAMRRQRG